MSLESGNKLRRPVLSTFCAAALLVVAGPVEAGDAERGAVLFLQCQACHALDADAGERLGPHLEGIIDNPSAAVDGYAYSDALREADLVWDEETLDAWLEDPYELVPGNKMAFAGIDADQDRADIIAYLESSQNSRAQAESPVP